MSAPDPERLERLLSGSVAAVAPRLLGAHVSHAGVVVRLTEVEAYGGADDPGSHAHSGRTARNATMFGPGGRLYCYLSYGVHVCANVTVHDPSGRPGAVLLRAGEVVSGMPTARARAPKRSDRDLARGPGRLGQVLGLSLDLDGGDLRSGRATMRPGPTVDPACVHQGPRVGLTQEADRAWRFWLVNEPTVSSYRRSPRAPSAPR